MSQALREWVGSNAAPAPTAAAWKEAELGEQLGFLSEEKRAKTVEMLLASASVDAQFQSLSEKRHKPESPDERQRVLEDYSRRRAELSAFLTPEEYENMDMTVSCTGDNLRRAMVHFQPTEAEFRAIFRAWRAQDENLATVYATGQPDPGKAAVYEKIKQALTPERYEQYVLTWWK
jgi:hypothetical protein